MSSTSCGITDTELADIGIILANLVVYEDGLTNSVQARLYHEVVRLRDELARRDADLLAAENALADVLAEQGRLHVVYLSNYEADSLHSICHSRAEAVRVAMTLREGLDSSYEWVTAESWGDDSFSLMLDCYGEVCQECDSRVGVNIYAGKKCPVCGDGRGVLRRLEPTRAWLKRHPPSETTPDDGQ